MNVCRYAAATAVLAAPMLLASAPARAVTAQQYAFQGQGLYMTSKGVPYGYVASPAVQPRGGYGAPVGTQVPDLEHHGRYTGGY